VAVTERRRRSDWSHFVRGLLDGRYREAERVVLVMDQLNTHSLASLHEAFPTLLERLKDQLAQQIREGGPPRTDKVSRS
jgi:hypothetical protein